MADTATQASQTVTIDGTEYNLADLFETAHSQVANLRVTGPARLRPQVDESANLSDQ
ncbi:hypothetical protein [Halomonas sp. WWR20]